MKQLRTSLATLLLIGAFGFSVFAQQPVNPSCGQPDPGQSETPPCSAQVDNSLDSSSTVSGDNSVVGTVSYQDSLTEIAVDLLSSIPPLLKFD